MKIITLVQKILMLSLVALLSGCGSDSTNGKPDKPPEDTSYLLVPQTASRQWLTYEELQSENPSKTSPYHNGYFTAIGAQSSDVHAFNGVLSFSAATLPGFPKDPSYKFNQFPEFSAHFFSIGEDLVPSNRDIIITSKSQSYWRVILSPGKVWREEADKGMSRASFPFLLVEHAYNSAFNGLATFLYDDDAVSDVRIQIVQHTSPNFNFESAATLALDYQPTPLEDISARAADYEQELSLKQSIKPWSALEAQFADANFSSFNGGMAAKQVSTQAIWYQGDIYLQSCQTELGPYPYCERMRHGIFSATKASAGGLALAHLAQLYGIEVLDYKIADYLDVTAEHLGWDLVTFKDALNMAVGVGNRDPDISIISPSADENREPMGRWSDTFTKSAKLAIAFNEYGNYPWGPGEVFRYNSTHTFVLSAAMDALVRQREGVGLWQLLKRNVYRPIGILHSPMMHTTEADPAMGVPILAVGLYPTVDDIVKIARLFQSQGQWQGEQLLHPEVVRQALFQTEDLGLLTYAHDNQYGQGRHNLSFWGVPFQGEGGCSMLVPFMSGSGGNLVTLLPNGSIGVLFTDEGSYDALAMVKAGARLGDMCQ